MRTLQIMGQDMFLKLQNSLAHSWHDYSISIPQIKETIGLDRERIYRLAYFTALVERFI